MIEIHEVINLEHQLKVFIMVVEERNFTKAGEKLHLTQPGVSQVIAKLEEVMGVRLIERTNKEFHLNKAGEIVYQYAKKIVKEYEQMKTHVEELQAVPSGPIVIGASYTIGEYILPELLVMLHQQYPEIIPDVIIDNTEEVGRKLLNHEIDIGFIEGDFTDVSIEKQLITVDEMYVYSSNRLNLSGDNLGNLLADQTWIIREKGSGTRKETERFLGKSNIKPRNTYTFGSTQIIKEGIESGLGISLLSKWAMKKELSLETVKQLELVGTPITRDLSIIKLKQEFIPKKIACFEGIVWKYKQNSLD